MQELQVTCVAFTLACLNSDGSYLGSLRKSILEFLSNRDNIIIAIDTSDKHILTEVFRILGLMDQERLFVRELGPLSDVVDKNTFLEDIRLPHYGSIISVGAVDEDLILRKFSNLHFHVGPNEYLRLKMRRVIPLTDQHEAGLANILRYFSQYGHGKKLWQYSDIADFVISSGQNFRKQEWGSKVLRKHIQVCQFIYDRFEENIAGLFGTGYPYYIFDGNFKKTCITAPKSVIYYFERQHSYFVRSCLSEDTLSLHLDDYYTICQATQNFGIHIGRKEICSNKEKFSFFSEERYTLSSLFELNCFDIETDIWKCQLCSSLQIAELYSDQRVIKGNNNCYECSQTTMKLRNVMGAGCDVDIIAVVHGDPYDICNDIKRAIIKESSYHLHDMNINRTMLDHDGPVDVFVFRFEEIMAAIKQLETPEWMNVTLEAVASWCPTTYFEAEIGLCFPICFEPVIVRDRALMKRFQDARKQFASGIKPEIIIDTLSNGSAWTQQLMSNESLRESLTQRIRHWRAGGHYAEQGLPQPQTFRLNDLPETSFS